MRNPTQPTPRAGRGEISEERQEKPLSLPRRLTEAYLAALFFLLPLYMHNAYFDITEAKVGCFALLSALYVLLLPFAELKCPAEGESKPGVWSFMLYIAVSIAASLLFVGRAALLAAANRYQGVLILALYALSFLFCARHGSFGRVPRLAALSALAVVSLCALLQSFGFDPLGLWEGIRAADRGRYLSTIGNVNFLGAYFALLLPLCAGLYCEKRVWGLLPLFALSCCALLCGSDGGVLGALAGLLFLYGLVSGERESHRAFGLLLTIMGLSLCLYALALKRFGLLTLSGVGSVLAAPATSLPLAALGLLLWFRGSALRRPWLPLLTLTAAAVLALLLCNCFPAKVPAALRSVLVFSRHWGSDRGAIWLHALALYRSFSPVQKLIGGGSGCLAAYDRAHRLFPDAIVDCAHNEYLQMLLTGGLLGLGAYLTTLVSALKTGAKKQPALAAAVFGCAVQAAVNIAQCATTPLLLTLIALL